MASSSNNGDKPWENRRERGQYFRAKYGNGPRNQNAIQNPPWVPQQQWPPYQQQQYPPYQQQPHAAPVTYHIHNYGGYAPPSAHYPYSQWSNGNQYMPPMPSMPAPYPPGYNPAWGQPAAFHSSWGQPASIPNQQGPYEGNRARQRPPPRQPTPGFVSEENGNTASSSNTGVGSLPKKPGTSQTPLETPENPIASQVPLALEVAQRPKTPSNIVDSTIIQESTMTEHPKTPTDTVTSIPPKASRPTERPKTLINTVVPVEHQGSEPIEHPTASPNDVTPLKSPGSKAMEQARLYLNARRKYPGVSLSATSSHTIKPHVPLAPAPKSDPAALLAWLRDRKARLEAKEIQTSSASPHASAHHELYEPKEIAKPTSHTGSREVPKQAARRIDPIVHVISDSPPSSVTSSSASLDMHVKPREALKQADLQDEPIYNDIPRPSSTRSSLPPLDMEIDGSSLSDHHTPARRFASPIDGSVRQTVVSPLYNNRKRMPPSHFEPEDESQETALQKDLPAAKRGRRAEQLPSKPNISPATERASRVLAWRQTLEHNPPLATNGDQPNEQMKRPSEHPASPFNKRVHRTEARTKPSEPYISPVINRVQAAEHLPQPWKPKNSTVTGRQTVQQFQPESQDEPLQPRLRRSERKSAKVPKDYCDITPSVADAMMKSTQATSTVDRTNTRASLNDDEFASSTSSFNPDGPDSESFADDPKPPLDIEHDEELFGESNGFAGEIADEENDIENADDSRPTQLTCKRVAYFSEPMKDGIYALYGGKRVQVRRCRGCSKWRDPTFWGGLSGLCSVCKSLSTQKMKQSKGTKFVETDNHYELYRLQFRDSQDRILKICWDCAGFVLEEDMHNVNSNCKYHRDKKHRKDESEQIEQIPWDQISGEPEGTYSRPQLEALAAMRGLSVRYQVNHMSYYQTKEDLIEQLQSYNDRLRTKIGEEAKIPEIGVGRLQPSLVISIIRFSTQKNETVATKWQEMAIQRFKTTYCVNPSILPATHTITGTHHATEQRCWLLDKRYELRDSLKSASAKSHVVMIIKGRDGLFTTDAPWRELWDSCGTKNFSLIFAEPLSRFKEEVLTGWEGDMEDGHLWIRFELRDVIAALQGKYKSVIYERLVKAFKSQSCYRYGLQDALNIGFRPRRNWTV